MWPDVTTYGRGSFKIAFFLRSRPHPFRSPAGKANFELCFFQRAWRVAAGKSPNSTHTSLPGERAKYARPTQRSSYGTNSKHSPYGSSRCAYVQSTSAVSGSILRPASLRIASQIFRSSSVIMSLPSPFLLLLAARRMSETCPRRCGRLPLKTRDIGKPQFSAIHEARRSMASSGTFSLIDPLPVQETLAAWRVRLPAPCHAPGSLPRRI